MPVVNVQLPAKSLDSEQKAELIARITDVVVEVERLPAIRPSVHVFINEVDDGSYGIGGRALDVAKAKAALERAGAASK